MHVSAHTLVDWESEDYPQTVCIRPEMHEESTLCVCFFSSVGDLNCSVSCPWRGESLGVFAPLARHRFLVSPEFGGRSLECGSWIALLCVCLDSSFGRHSRVAYISASCGHGVLGVFAPSPRPLGVLRGFVVHVGSRADSCGGILASGV